MGDVWEFSGWGLYRAGEVEHCSLSNIAGLRRAGSDRGGDKGAVACLGAVNKQEIKKK